MGQVGAVWMAVMLGLIMLPSVLGISLGISEAYMWVLVKTLEVGGSSGGEGGCSWRCVARGAAPRSLPPGRGGPGTAPSGRGVCGAGCPGGASVRSGPIVSSCRGEQAGHVLPGISSARL